MNQLLPISRFIFISIFIFVHSFFSFSQKDFNNYQTLLSKGEMPADFTILVQQKVLNDIAANKVKLATKLDTQLYLESIHEQLNEILYSGRVIYGDEVSVYIQDLANRLLKDNPELAKELRFYTIKSNETNAFSTAPGIIFVTTGLIAQLSSEAQLAFILSHEIAHYEQKHTHKEYLNYKKTGKIKNNKQLLGLSQFSKENELEADSLALVRYNKMGYSEEELTSTFDLLMYSYLPFDEVPFPSNYFNTPNSYIPEKEFDLDIKPITAEENYNDTYSSHPNIKKRKDAIQKIAAGYSHWGTTSFLLSKEEFEYVRTICRFESVRMNVLEGGNFSALYSIFLLEKQFRNSIFLDRMKTLSWLSILRLKSDFEKVKESKEIEGESSLLCSFLRSSNNKERAIMGLRISYDLKAKYPEDKFFHDSYEIYLNELAKTDLIKLSDYQPLNFHQASLKALSKEPEPLPIKEDSTSFDAGTKYSRIKEKRSIKPVLAFDSTNFIAYAIPDIITDSLFLKKFKILQEQSDSITDETTRFQLLNEKDKEKAWQKTIDHASLQEPQFKDVLIVEPSIHYYTKYPPQGWETLARNKSHLNTIFTNAKNQGFSPIIISEDSLRRTTASFNEYLTYLAYLEQLAEANKGRDCLAVDYEIVNKFASDRKTTTLLFTMIEFDGTEGKSLNMYSLVLNTQTGKSYNYVQRNLNKVASPITYGPHYENLFKLIREF
ncbi:M48 family metallopeptidase [Fluviicola taffensis]|uniref:M48 family metallopeptidase n=1 Tax=Fluviicola taffensis TaxID=191579 RepID=UPI003137760C